MLLSDFFNEVFLILIYYKLLRDVRDLLLLDEVVLVFEIVGIKDLEVLIKYDKFIFYYVFKDDEFLFKEINDLFELYYEEKLFIFNVVIEVFEVVVFF